MEDDSVFKCPECDSLKVTVTAEQKFMVNSGEHYCHSVKTQDHNAKTTCLDCNWIGTRQQLKEKQDQSKVTNTPSTP